MTLIESSAEVITQDNPFKKIEIAGRTCYKSEVNITEESALKFYKRLVENNHTAMLEHATFVFLTTNLDLYTCAQTYKYINTTATSIFTGNSVGFRYLISGNLRAINETCDFDLLYALYLEDPNLVYSLNKDMFTHKQIENSDTYVVKLSQFKDLSQNEIASHYYVTMRFVCDRGVSHEIVRHRPFSFAQESTRYVNYSKDKFGGGDIKFIKPHDFDTWPEKTQTVFSNMLEDSEINYNKLTSKEYGFTAQQARAVLPNAVKTEIVVTGNGNQWQHFFNLRSKGTTGAPHPDMKELADKALEIYPTYSIDEE